MKRYSKVASVVALLGAVFALTNITPVSAQCATCPQPVVAFSPVVAPATTTVFSPVVAPATTVTFQPVTGWYPGRLLDTWRMRRWGYTTPVAVTTAMPVTAAMPITTAMPVTSTFVPQTVGFAPIATTGWPHVTSFAPLGQRQVFMQPVVAAAPVMAAASVMAAGCATCAPACEPCSACASTTVVEQATYAEAAPTPCTNCAQGTTITYADQASVGSTETSQPTMTPDEAAPLKSNYPEGTPPQNSQQPDPGPAAEDQPAETNTYLEPPALFNPGDRITQQQESVKPVNRAPSVNVWNAVYRQGANADNVSTSTARSQAEIDAEGWHSVPAK